MQEATASTALYSELDISTHEIRLLILPYNKYFQPPNLDCEMIKVSLKDNPKYRTISYSWRTDSHMGMRVVYVNNRCHLVTDNLERLLRRLSSRHADVSQRIFWVDQVCINQENMSERGQQVGLMGQIYEKAQGLIIWLGESTMDQCFLAMSVLKDLGQDSSGGEEMDNRQALLFEQLKRQETPFAKRAFEAVSALFRTPWWKRAWVVQELALSKHAIEVLWGTTAIPWFTLIEAVVRITQESLDATPENAVLHNIECSHAISLQRVHRHADNAHLYYPIPTLLELCCMFAANEASNPRDKIFAFMGLAVDSDESVFAPDYDSPVHQVYQNFARHVISRTESLDILRVASCGYATYLPTWVPDWDQKPSGFRGLHRLMGSRIRPFHDTRAKKFDSTIGSKAKTSLSNNLCHLIIQGHCVQTVLEVTAPLHDRDTASIIERQQIITILDGWEKCARKHLSGIYPTGEPFVEAFWRTLMANSDVEGHDVYNLTYECDFERAFNVFMERTTELDEFINGKEGEEKEDLINTLSRPFYLSMFSVTYDQVFFITNNGYIGLAPSGTKVGDNLCLLLGASMPFLLRGAGDQFSLIGSAYCHGFMNGEVFKRLQQEGNQPEWLCLQ